MQHDADHSQNQGTPSIDSSIEKDADPGKASGNGGREGPPESESWGNGAREEHKVQHDLGPGRQGSDSSSSEGREGKKDGETVSKWCPKNGSAKLTRRLDPSLSAAGLARPAAQRVLHRFPTPPFSSPLSAPFRQSRQENASYRHPIPNAIILAHPHFSPALHIHLDSPRSSFRSLLPLFPSLRSPECSRSFSACLRRFALFHGLGSPATWTGTLPRFTCQPVITAAALVHSNTLLRVTHSLFSLQIRHALASPPAAGPSPGQHRECPDR